MDSDNLKQLQDKSIDQIPKILEQFNKEVSKVNIKIKF